jgi:hypothetical protein
MTHGAVISTSGVPDHPENPAAPALQSQSGWDEAKASAGLRSPLNSIALPQRRG